MTEPRSDYFSVADIREIQTLANTFFLQEILNHSQYFSPKSIRNKFVKVMQIDNIHASYELMVRFLRYTLPNLTKLLRIGAVQQITRYSYRILDKSKIESMIT